jgi:hypothetical protein
MNTRPHLSDEMLLLSTEDELCAADREHFESCEQCRERSRELSAALEGIAHRLEWNPPGLEAGRAYLQARLSASHARRRWTAVAAALGIVAVGTLLAQHIWQGDRIVHAAVVSAPNPRLTPGVTLLIGRPALCAQPNPNNKTVPVALQRKVFAEYGIAGAPARAYEVDYLVTPALGGADDIHNLWPHSHTSTIWNARVKDALEDRLHEMVCEGSLDLHAAQQEIASDWIAAYRKYFHTEQPLPEHTKNREP